MSDRKTIVASRIKQRPKIPDDLEQALSSLSRLNIDAVRQRWQAWFADAPPACQSGRVLRLILAWRLQEARLGGLSVGARRHLRQLTGVELGNTIIAQRPALKRGMVLAREWKGAMHRVHVLEGGFAHKGKVYATLSEVARAITGTRWSGPRFFGITSGVLRERE